MNVKSNVVKKYSFDLGRLIMTATLDSSCCDDNDPHSPHAK
jgi:hypothetical protein